MLTSCGFSQVIHAKPPPSISQTTVMTIQIRTKPFRIFILPAWTSPTMLKRVVHWN